MKILAVAGTACLSGLVAGAVALQTQADASRSALIEPRAAAILQDMSQTLAESNELTFHAEITFDDVLTSGQKIQYAAVLDAILLRPNRFFVELVSDLGARRIWHDGTLLTVYDGPANVYAAFAVGAPDAPVEQVLDRVAKEKGISMPLTDLVASDPFESLTSDVAFGFYVGLHDVRGTQCHHLAFVQQFIEWQIWIDAGPVPLPRKLVITYKTVPNSPQYVAELSDWDQSPRWGPGRFNASVPEDATMIDFLEAPTLNGGR